MSRDPVWFAWLSVFGAVAMIVAASLVDWRLGVFVGGLVLWVDLR